ncbi:Macrolide export protein MacA [Aquisphaera giovannonii]|uniref:Macrolide export protein MacA n=1 Tax=Aquisphaera giovannonii TaxID=406548 RepID=A0A5B9WB32_9BACT|nr:efflux RND transporter periplasmic adaptor subunit [Aquisphaera giovannonii]QEH37221.1 Macrolide export protein MacA [Aquisphaera giovannonii]
MLRKTLIAVGLGLLLLTLFAANRRREPGAVDLDWRVLREPPRKVLAEPATRGPIVQTVTAPGKVESVEEAEVASQLIGRVVAVYVEEGDVVLRNDPLVELDATDAKARLDSACARIAKLTAAITQAESELAKAERDVDQFSKLRVRGFASPTERADAVTLLEKARAALAMSRNELREAEAMRRSSDEELRRTLIVAPMDGVVSNLNVDEGEIVIAGTTNLPGSVLMKVSAMGRMRVRADVDETDVLSLRRGQPAQAYLLASQLQPLAGRVETVAPQGKASKDDVVNFETLIAIDAPAQTSTSGEDHRLRPGMTATVEVEVRRSDDAISVPAQAVVHRRRKDLPDTPAVRSWAERNARSPGEKARDAELRYVKLVFVLDGGVARARPVETGLSDERRVEILSGLEPEDRVIVGPFRALDELKDGAAVVPVASATELETTG